MKKALYALKTKIASFDFYSWLVMAKANGYTEVVFDVRSPKTNKWPADVVLRRFETIIKPGPALAGLDWSFGEEGEDALKTDARYLIEFARRGRTFEPLRSVYEPGDVRYTVTLRNDRRIPDRNSNAAAWREFAAEIGALVLEDYEDNAIDLYTRAALYAGAEMNFFVPNGPMHVASLMGAPLLCFACDRCAGGFANTGIAVGQNYPWHSADQRLIWEPDDLSTIRRHFNRWRETQCVQESSTTAS